MTIHRTFASALLGATLLMGTAALQAPLHAATSGIEAFAGADPTSFASPEEAVTAFTASLAAGDLAALAKLLGLDEARLKSYDGIGDRLAELQVAAKQLVSVKPEGDVRVISLGAAVWPFPFPVVKGKTGQWSFDTYAGLEEIINRRVGENEIEAIATARAYVEAQRDYASRDHDADGVLEYAQKLVSGEGLTDGLFWPAAQGDGNSPAGDMVNQAAMEKAKAGEGYFGYRFRVLRGQGSNIAGGRYDYVVNGNMLAGFGLIAWPVKYAETGVNTFVVNHAGVVYEKDLGPATAEVVEKIRRFNPDATWTVTGE